MPLKYLLDENLRGPLWTAIQRQNLAGDLPIDTVRVGDAPDLPAGMPDPLILTWCDTNGRLLVSLDRSTLETHLRHHLAAGGHTPGIFLLKPQSSMKSVVEFLVLAAHATEAEEWRDQIWFIP